METVELPAGAPLAPDPAAPRRARHRRVGPDSAGQVGETVVGAARRGESGRPRPTGCTWWMTGAARLPRSTERRELERHWDPRHARLVQPGVPPLRHGRSEPDTLVARRRRAAHVRARPLGGSKLARPHFESEPGRAGPALLDRGTRRVPTSAADPVRPRAARGGKRTALRLRVTVAAPRARATIPALWGGEARNEAAFLAASEWAAWS